jgi:hypothetical protein
MRNRAILGVMGLTVVAMLFPATPVRASITVLDQYNLGENDPGAVVGGIAANPTIDAVGTNHLQRGGSPTYSGSTRAPGSTLAVDFNGVNQWYSLGAPLTTAVDDFGMDLWLRPDSVATTTFMHNGYIAANLDGYGIMILGGAYQGHFPGRSMVGIAAVQTGNWTHLALVRTGGTAPLYINGHPSGATATAAPAAPTTAFSLAATHTGGTPFDGLLDQARVFTFDAGQFNPLTDLPYVSPFQVMGHYRLGEHDAGAGAGLPGAASSIDETGAFPLSKSGSPTYSADVPIQNSPRSTLSLQLSGADVDGYSAASVLTTANDNYILEAWVKPDSTTDNGIVAYNGNSGSSGFGLMEYNGRWQGLHGGLAFLDFGAPVETGVWHHLAMVRDNGITRLYVDGRQQGTTFNFVPGIPKGNFLVGSGFDGLVDEVRLSLFTGPFDVGMLTYVPEPSTFALLGLGFTGLLGFRWRRRRK